MSYNNAVNFLNDKSQNHVAYNFEREFGLIIENAFERYFTYKAATMKFSKKEEKEKCRKLYPDAVIFCDSMKKEHPGIFEPDGADGKCELVKDIYGTLWDWNKDDSYGNYRKINDYGTLFGGDTANTIQTVMNFYAKIMMANNQNNYKEDKEEYSLLKCLQLYCNKDKVKSKLIINEEFIKLFSDYINVYHTIGNFVLVPAYFNPFKGGKGLMDFFDAGLNWLKENDWDVAKQLSRYVHRKRLVEVIKSLGEMPQNLKQMLEKKELTDDDVKEIRNHIAVKKRKIYKNLSSKHFNKYINTMFLWDYTLSGSADSNNKYMVKSLCKGKWSDQESQKEYNGKNECRSNEMTKDEIRNFISNAKYAIERRSFFMVAMLRIALGENLDGESQYEYDGNKSWNKWKVSGIYKQIMDDVFLTNDLYADYIDVIGKKDEDKGIYRVVEKVKNKNGENSSEVKFITDILSVLTTELKKDI